MSDPASLPVGLTGDERRNFHRALLDAFDLDGLTQLTSFELDEDLEEITEKGNLRKIAFDLITWAEANGRVLDLARAAHRQNPGSPELAAVLHSFEARVPFPAPPPQATAAPATSPNTAADDRRPFAIVVGVTAVIVAAVVFGFMPPAPIERDRTVVGHVYFVAKGREVRVPVAGVTVSDALTGSMSQPSDTRGRFVLANVPRDRTLLIASYGGRSYSLDLKVFPNGEFPVIEKP